MAKENYCSVGRIPAFDSFNALVISVTLFAPFWRSAWETLAFSKKRLEACSSSVSAENDV